MDIESLCWIHAIHDRCDHLRSCVSHIAHYGTRGSIQGAQDLFLRHVYGYRLPANRSAIIHCILSWGNELDGGVVSSR